MSQITANSAKLILGSADVLIGTTEANAVSIGAGYSIKLVEAGDVTSLEFDNADVVETKSKKSMSLSMDLAEIDLGKVNTIFAGTSDVYTVNAGTPVTGATQVIASGWLADTFIPLTNQMYDGSANTISSVVASSTGALVLDTDYFKGFDASGRYGIWIADVLAETVTITYNYTPAASKSLLVKAANFVAPSFVVIVRHTTSAGKKVEAVLYKAASTKFFELTFGKDSGGDPTKTSVEFKGTADANGNIYKITDERVY